jgi:hypothetical protein
MLAFVRRGGKNRASPEETNSTKASIGRMVNQCSEIAAALQGLDLKTKPDESERRQEKFRLDAGCRSHCVGGFCGLARR